METATSPPTPPGASLAATLIERHAALAERMVMPDGVSKEDRARLVHDIVAAGVEVPPGPERDGLRNLLFFWAGDQSFRGERKRSAPPPDLASYEPAEQPSAPEPDAGPLANAGQGPVPAILSSPDPDQIGQMGAGPSRTASTPLQLAQKATKLLTLVAPTAVSNGAGSNGAGSNGAASNGSAADTDADARQVIRLSAIARQWRLAGEGQKRGYLLSDDRTLADAARYAGNDPDLAALVEASKQALVHSKGKRRQFMYVLAGVTVVALLALATALFMLFTSADRRRAAAESEANTLRIVNSEWAEARGQVRQSAADAVDGLRTGNLTPLESLLRTLGSADADDLARLRLDPSGPEAPNLSFAAPAPLSRPAGAPPAPAASGAACDGYLWFGAAGPASRLPDHRDPSTLKSGETVTIAAAAATRLRSAWPSDAAGRANRQIGLVPPGAQVVLASDPRTFPPRNDEVWAEVRVARAYCSTVFLQFSGPAEKRDAVLAALRALDVQVPPAERIASAKGLAEIRYFTPEDEPVAAQAAAALAPFNGGVRLGVIRLTNLPAKPAPGTIEAWLDLAR